MKEASIRPPQAGLESSSARVSWEWASLGSLTRQVVSVGGCCSSSPSLLLAVVVCVVVVVLSLLVVRLFWCLGCWVGSRVFQ